MFWDNEEKERGSMQDYNVPTYYLVTRFDDPNAVRVVEGEEGGPLPFGPEEVPLIKCPDSWIANVLLQRMQRSGDPVSTAQVTIAGFAYPAVMPVRFCVSWTIVATIVYVAALLFI